MKIRERGDEKDSKKARGCEVFVRWKQKKRTIKRENTWLKPHYV